MEKKAGIVLNPQTPIESIKYLLPKLDYVLIMTVNPGFGGQKFIPEMLEKIEELAKLREEKNYNFLIEVDGGINTETSKACRDKGADLLVCGSFLFGASDKEKTLGELLKIMNTKKISIMLGGVFPEKLPSSGLWCGVDKGALYLLDKGINPLLKLWRF